MLKITMKNGEVYEYTGCKLTYDGARLKVDFGNCGRYFYLDEVKEVEVV